MDAVFSGFSEVEKRFLWIEFARRARVTKAELRMLGEDPLPQGVMAIDPHFTVSGIRQTLETQKNNPLQKGRMDVARKIAPCNAIDKRTLCMIPYHELAV